MFKIPVSARSEIFSIDILGVTYRMRTFFANGWHLDISTADDEPLVLAIPLVTGVDLLEQYRHLGLGISLTIQSLDETVGYGDLGARADLIFEALP